MSTANVKLGENILNGVSTIKLKDADHAGEFVTFELAGAEPTEVVEKDICFFDYDGTLIESWTLEELAGKSALPAAPTHTGLVSDGWNWTLQQIKTFNQPVDVGHLYHTESGLVEISVLLNKYNGLTVQFNPNYYTMSKDWGDGTVNSEVSHTYSDYGEYTISFAYSESIPQLQSGGELSIQVTEIRLPSTITKLGANLAGNFTILEKVSMPASVTSCKNNIFNYTSRLEFLAFGPGFDMGASGLQNSSIRRVSVASGFYFYYKYYFEGSKIEKFSFTTNRVDERSFYNCTNLKRVYSTNLEYIPDMAFQGCPLTHLDTTKLKGIGSSGLSGNQLDYIKITDVTQFPGGSLRGKNIIIDFSDYQSIPTLVATGAINKHVYLKIIVPDALYDEWIVATNWTYFENNIYKASEV